MKRRTIGQPLLAVLVFASGALACLAIHFLQPKPESDYYLVEFRGAGNIISLPMAQPLPIDHETQIIQRENPTLGEAGALRLWALIDESFQYLDELDAPGGGATGEINRQVAIAVMLQESKGEPLTQGRAGEIGLFQIMPNYHTAGLHSAGILDTINAAELWEPGKNATAGIYLLKQYAAGVPTLDRALMRYNAGYKESNGAGYLRKIKPLIAELQGDGRYR